MAKRCPTCRGKGTIKCKKCGGIGRIDIVGGLFGSPKCDRCDGLGEHTCPNCGGTGQV
jgi:hypothetical protein